MRTISMFLILIVSFAFAGEATTSPKPDTKAATELANINPSKEQLSKAKPMHNTVCPISGEKLGSMGKPIPVIYKGQIINLCCMGCQADFEKNPEKYYQIALKSSATAGK